MKKITTYLTLILSSICIFSSCSDDDNNPSPTVAGEWNAFSLTIYSETYNQDIDPYVQKAFNDVLEENKISRVFDESSKTVKTTYINSLGSEVLYSTENYETKGESLYLTSGNVTNKYEYSVSTPILTTQWNVNRDQLTAILSKMDKAPVAAILPDDYQGVIKFEERRKTSN